MSYQYRKAKRLRSHLILKFLYECHKEDLKKPKGSYVSWHDPYQASAYNESDISQINGSIQDLKEKAFIGTEPYENFAYCSITEKGIDAYLESLYLVENRKDWLESKEHITKWIIPVISIILSIGASVISILVLIHTWNKK